MKSTSSCLSTLISHAALIQKTIDQIRTGFQTAFVQGDEVRGTMEAWPPTAMDGALLEGINFTVITNPNQVQSARSRMRSHPPGQSGRG
jgi:hypothetical protein